MPRISTYQYESMDAVGVPPLHHDIAWHASFGRTIEEISRAVNLTKDTVESVLRHKPVQDKVNQLVTERALSHEETFRRVVEGHAAAVARMASAAADPKTPLAQVVTIERELGKIHPDQRMKPTTALIQRGSRDGLSSKAIEEANVRGRKLLELEKGEEGGGVVEVLAPGGIPDGIELPVEDEAVAELEEKVSD